MRFRSASSSPALEDTLLATMGAAGMEPTKLSRGVMDDIAVGEAKDPIDAVAPVGPGRWMSMGAVAGAVPAAGAPTVGASDHDEGALLAAADGTAAVTGCSPAGTPSGRARSATEGDGVARMPITPGLPPAAGDGARYPSGARSVASSVLERPERQATADERRPAWRAGAVWADERQRAGHASTPAGRGAYVEAAIMSLRPTLLSKKALKVSQSSSSPSELATVGTAAVTASVSGLIKIKKSSVATPCNSPNRSGPPSLTANAQGS